MSTIHHLAHRPRLAITAVLGLLVGALLPSEWRTITRVLAAWNVAAWLYLLSIAWMMAHADPKKMRAVAEQEDQSAVAVLATLSMAAVLSLIAIVLVLAGSTSDTPNARLLHYAFTVSTLLVSWLLVGVLFTLHYTHLYFRSPVQHRALDFPGHEAGMEPEYWDFLYFSFTIACAAQTADVNICSRTMRRAVLGQSILSFFFNAAILGLSINIAAGLVGGHPT